MKRKNIDFSLLWKKIYGAPDVSETREIDQWLADDPENQKHFESLEAFQKNRPDISEEQQHVAWQRLQSRLLPAARPLKPAIRRTAAWYLYRAAAVFALAAFSFALWKYDYTLHDTGRALAINPGKSSATLITASGLTVHLGDSTVQLSTKGIPANASRSSLTYYGSLAAAAAEEINKLVVPRGGEFQLTLADGTRVWLNAESTLEYPTHFTGTTRTVQLTGEAYFEVAKNAAKPFNVVTDKQTIAVLGTSFNVSAYPQDAGIYSTLVEGSLRVDGEQGKSLLISPGSQCAYNPALGDMTSRVVDTYTYTSWKDGLFVFDDEALSSIMQRIGRWYNVDVSYANNQQQHTRFTMQIDKFQPITEVLKLIALTNEIDFEISDNTIIVK
jgi:ferric-dicitrate binding protein FerR (iron transport regulator)